MSSFLNFGGIYYVFNHSYRNCCKFEANSVDSDKTPCSAASNLGFQFAKVPVGDAGYYRKNSKNWDTRNNYHNCPTIGTVGFYSAVLCSKDADRTTNREDPDQTAP